MDGDPIVCRALINFIYQDLSFDFVIGNYSAVSGTVRGRQTKVSSLS